MGHGSKRGLDVGTADWGNRGAGQVPRFPPTSSFRPRTPTPGPRTARSCPASRPRLACDLECPGPRPCLGFPGGRAGAARGGRTRGGLATPAPGLRAAPRLLGLRGSAWGVGGPAAVRLSPGRSSRRPQPDAASRGQAGALRLPPEPARGASAWAGSEWRGGQAGGGAGMRLRGIHTRSSAPREGGLSPRALSPPGSLTPGPRAPPPRWLQGLQIS